MQILDYILFIDGIIDMTGIEAFTSLTYLDCQHNQIASLNISANTALTYLDCGNNLVSNLDVSNNLALTDLICMGNQISSLIVSTNINLTYLICGSNLLTSLNVASNSALTILSCVANQIQSLDLSANTALTNLLCDDNQLSSINLTSNTALTDLTCGYNNLTSLNLLTNADLNVLNCQGNQLTSIHFSPNTPLIWLDCSLNQLTSLNIQNGNNSNLSFFNATNNHYLDCIQLDDVAYMNTNWLNGIDTSASFSTNCNNTPTNCNANFTMIPDTVPHVWYVLNQCNGNGTINYTWSWGDGSSNDSTANPSHTFATAGYYNICVNITDSIGCTNFHCDSSTYINKSIANTVIQVNVVYELPSYLNTNLTTNLTIQERLLSCYPNPTKDILNIQVSGKYISQNTNWSILDVLGNEIQIQIQMQNVKSKMQSDNSLNFELSTLNLKSGIYFIKFGNEVVKFIKE